jgi:hypothetical protein
LADGSKTSSDRYVLHKMAVGNHVITDVVANVSSAKSDPLLGQSFLQKLPAWTLDNSQHALVLKDEGGRQHAAARPPAPQSQEAAPAPAAPPSPMGMSLRDIFNADMWHIQVPFLESKIGVARRVSDVAGGQIRTYTVEDCELTAYVSNKEVVGYGLILGGDRRSVKSNCNINLENRLNAKDLTIGKFVSIMGVGIADEENLFNSPCIHSCGNAADPTVIFHYEGPHASNFVKIDLISAIDGEVSVNAVERWRNLMTKAEGESYVMSARFNCDAKYQRLGLQLFRDVEVYKIIIGYGDFRRETNPSATCGGR